MESELKQIRILDTGCIEHMIYADIGLCGEVLATRFVIKNTCVSFDLQKKSTFNTVWHSRNK